MEVWCSRLDTIYGWQYLWCVPDAGAMLYFQWQEIHSIPRDRLETTRKIRRWLFPCPKVLTSRLSTIFGHSGHTAFRSWPLMDLYVQPGTALKPLHKTNLHDACSEILIIQFYEWTIFLDMLSSVVRKTMYLVWHIEILRHYWANFGKLIAGRLKYEAN